MDAGADVEADDPIVEIATDQVDSEVPAPEDGTLVEWCVAEGDVVQVGAVIARYDVGGEGSGDSAAPASAEAPAPAPAQAAPNSPSAAVVEEVMAPLEGGPARKGPSGRFYSPLVRSIAEKEGISMAELESMSGSVLKVRSPKRTSCRTSKAAVKLRRLPSLPLCRLQHPWPRSRLPRLPRPAWTRPTTSWKWTDAQNDCGPHGAHNPDQSPRHFVCGGRRDQLGAMAQRQQKTFQEKFEESSRCPLIAEACQGDPRLPWHQCQCGRRRILIHKNITSAWPRPPSGNGYACDETPTNTTCRDSRVRSTTSLRARAGKLTPDDIAGGATMSNVGTFGNVMSTHHQPAAGGHFGIGCHSQTCGVGDEQGDVIAVRNMMFLNHSYDHRVVDGMLGRLCASRGRIGRVRPQPPH